MTAQVIPAGSLARRLELACAITHALLDVCTRAEEQGTPEALRRRSEALALIEDTPLAFAIFDAGTFPRIANAAWRALFGASAPPELAEPISRALRPGAEVEHVAQLALASMPHPVYVALTLRPQRTTAGAILACVVTTDDVFAGELGVTGDALIWSAPLARDADYCNERWRTYVGRDLGAWQRAIADHDVARCTAALGEATRERVSSDVEARLRRADGEYRWHRVKFSVDRAGSRWFATAIDIHDARDAEAERSELLARERSARADAELANRLKDQFLAAVSHELRAPLTTMLLWEKVLVDDTSDRSLHQLALDAIHESALLQSRLVGDLLDISRGISGKLYVDLRPVDLESIVSSALAAATLAANDKQITLERDGQAADEVLGDASRLRQVLDNLLANAIKFTAPGGHVTVRVERQGRSLVIEVADTGRGIAPEFLPHLFEPFRQAEDALTRSSGGLGLGLAIAKQLVELHHGTLTASSRGVGQGATLSMTLPLAGRRATPPPVGLTKPPRLDGIEVLVVDDDRRVRDALALLLSRVGAIVETAESAKAARKLIAESAPDVIVCDIAMPDEDGYQLVQELRGRNDTTPAIALTGHATEGDSRRALSAGFDLHLAKPINLDGLVRAIDDVLTARRSGVPIT